MQEIYKEAALMYREMVEDSTLDPQVCSCANDVLANGVLDQLLVIAQRFKYAARDGRARDRTIIRYPSSRTMFLVKNSLRPKIQKVLPQFITHALGLGMGKCEWGKVEFFNFGLPLLSFSSLKDPE